MASSSNSAGSVTPQLKALVGSMFGPNYNTLSTTVGSDTGPAHGFPMKLWHDGEAWEEPNFVDRVIVKEEQVGMEHKRAVGFQPTLNPVTVFEDGDTESGKG